MSVFEYSSVFIAILAGQVAKELLQRMAFIMKQDRWILLYFAEWLTMTAYLIYVICYFFVFFVSSSELNSLQLLPFLGQVV